MKISTASHKAEKYKEFISFSSTSSLQKKAADIMYYVLDKEDITIHPKKDSLQNVLNILPNKVFPVIEKGLLGFYDQSGKQQITNLYTEIPETAKCQLTSDDWVFVKKNETGFIITKAGQIVLEHVDEYRSISLDVGLVRHEERWYLYHKSGFKIIDQSIQDADVLANKWIKVKQKDKWGLYTFLGLPIAESIYDDIFKTESFWVFEKNGLLAVYTEQLILKEIEEKGLSLEFKFDDIELVNENALIGFRDYRECLLDSTLNFLVPWGNYEINPESSGWYLKSDLGYRLYNESEEEVMDRHYPYLESNEGWLALQTETDWMLIPRTKGLSPTRGYDSIKLVNTFAAILIENGSKSLLFSSGENLQIDDKQIRTFQNHSEFISITDASNTRIYNAEGKELVSGKFENTTFLNDSLVRVQIRGKHGLIHINGDWILNPLFDSIDEKNGLMLTLIKGKIGCYDPQINQLIAAEYDARVERLANYYLVKKDGKYGVIDHVKSEILSFSYDEIKTWNDSSYLVKIENQYLI
ncbi:MAG: WG repeat-containing protein, partial [Marinoscillum sp.]